MLIHIIVVVWGKNYIDAMRDYALPTLLYQNNLPAVAARHDCVLRLYCRPEEEAEILSMKPLGAVRDCGRVEITHIQPETAPTIYVAMAQAHHDAAVRAQDCSAKAIFYCPDAIMADGTLARAAAVAEAGKRAFLVPGLRISQEKVAAHLKPIVRSDAPLSPRAMLQAIYPILHPEMFRYFWDSPDFTGFASMCCWPVGDTGFLMRAFHLHPLMIDFARVKSAGVMQSDTVDGDFISQAIGIWSDIEIEQDSDRSGVFNITSETAFYSYPTHEPGNITTLRRSAFAPNVNAFHRFLFAHPIKFHLTDMDERWTETEEKTGLLLEQFLQPLPPAPPPPIIEPRQKIEVDPYTKYIYDRVREFHWTVSRWVRKGVQLARSHSKEDQ